MTQPPQRRSVIAAAAQVVRRLVSEPFQSPDESEDEDSGTIYAEPLQTELPIENERPALFPAQGYIRNGLQFLNGRTIWAVDGGILTWQFPNGLLIVGRAVVSRMSFTGTETVQRVFDIPVVPLFYTLLSKPIPQFCQTLKVRPKTIYSLYLATYLNQVHDCKAEGVQAIFRTPMSSWHLCQKVIMRLRCRTRNIGQIYRSDS